MSIAMQGVLFFSTIVLLFLFLFIDWRYVLGNCCYDSDDEYEIL